MKKVYSSIDENCRRLNAIFDLISAQYIETSGDEARKKYFNGDELTSDEKQIINIIIEEADLIGLFITWAVITIEGLVNHIIADNTLNKILAIASIENPRKIIENMKRNNQISSELGIKILILGENNGDSEKIALKAEEVVKIRNMIVHDKPYEYEYTDSGDLEIKIYTAKQKDEIRYFYFEDLQKILGELNEIYNYVMKNAKATSIVKSQELSFAKLFKRYEALV
jgi:hypothetical protein